MNLHKTKAFTLVELIIVITILAILAIIGFISFQSYTLDARDSSRITSLKELSNGLQVYQTKKGSLPHPDEQVTTISSGTTTISYQGYAGSSVQQAIRSTEMKDPKENIPYTYIVSADKTKYQLLALLENGTTVNTTSYNNLVNTTYAANSYTGRYMYTVGNKVGVFVDNLTKAPVQETLTGINLATNTNTFKVVFANTTSNSGVIVGSGILLAQQVQIISNTVAVARTAPINDGHGFFKRITYVGNSGIQGITGLGLQPDFVWIKAKNKTYNNQISDSIRGVSSRLYTDTTGIQDTTGMLSSFDINGFSLLGTIWGNELNSLYVAWCIKAPTQFSGTTSNGKAYTGKTNGSWFSMVKHTESGTNTYSTFPHGLTVRPSLIIHKNLTTVGNWLVRYEEGNKLLTLNLANAATNYDFTGWSSSTNIHSLMDSSANDSIMTYSFASVPGVTKIGTYQGTGLSGNSIDLGFQPAFVMIKNLQDNGSQWYIYDNKRGTSILMANRIDSELSGYNVVITNNGFRIDNTNSDWNASGRNYLYLAIAE